MPTLYAVTYSGASVDYDSLLTHRLVQGMDPEFGRRVVGACVAATAAGQPLGIGGTIRLGDGQERLFLSRHHEAAPDEKACCTYQGIRYALDHGEAHAAPPGLSYHEPVTAAGLCLACDTIGRAGWNWLHVHAAEYGLIEFSDIGNEPWHVQPIEIPKARRLYRPAVHEPLKPFALPGQKPPVTIPPIVHAPTPVLRRGARNDKAEVRELQVACNFWGWRDAYGRRLVVDGDYAARTAQAVMAMQKALGLKRDGIYGKVTAAAFHGFLGSMAKAAA